MSMFFFFSWSGAVFWRKKKKSNGAVHLARNVRFLIKSDVIFGAILLGKKWIGAFDEKKHQLPTTGLEHWVSSSLSKQILRLSQWRFWLFLVLALIQNVNAEKENDHRLILKDLNFRLFGIFGDSEKTFMLPSYFWRCHDLNLTKIEKKGFWRFQERNFRLPSIFSRTHDLNPTKNK